MVGYCCRLVADAWRERGLMMITDFATFIVILLLRCRAIA